MRKETRALIVLSGGESRRFGGKDKGLYQMDGIPLVNRVINALAQFADYVIVQVAPGRREEYRRAIGPDVILNEDSASFKGPLSGLSEALRLADSEIILLSPCDLPDIPAELYDVLLSRLVGHDAAVPRIGGYPEPITAVYDKGKLSEAVSDELKEKRSRLSGVLEHLDVAYVSERELERSGVRIASLRGLNTPP